MGLFQDDDEFILERTVVQSDDNLPLDPGLIQAGVYRSGGLQLDMCGTSGKYRIFIEVKQYGVSGTLAYKCQLFNEVSPGTIVTLDVFRFPTAGEWGIRTNGVPTGTIYHPDFDTGAPAIGSEIQIDVGKSDYLTQAATRFGAAGHAGWSVYTTVGRRGRRRVGRSDQTHVYVPKIGHWKVPRPPTPLTITHTP